MNPYNRPVARLFCGGGLNRSNLGTFYDYAWIILRSRWIWPFWGGGQMTPLTPPWLRACINPYFEVINVEPWWWNANPKVLDLYLYHDLAMLPPLSWFFFVHLLFWEYPDHHQNVISSSLYYPGPLHKISSQSVHNFLSNVVHNQTNRQTDKPMLPKT